RTAQAQGGNAGADREAGQALRPPAVPSPIDPARRTERIRRTRKAGARRTAEAQAAFESQRATPTPPADAPQLTSVLTAADAAEAIFAAQLIGQDADPPGEPL